MVTNKGKGWAERDKALALLCRCDKFIFLDVYTVILVLSIISGGKSWLPIGNYCRRITKKRCVLHWNHFCTSIFLVF